MQWQYRVVALDDAAKVKKADELDPVHLNELGGEGWEAVGLTLRRGDLVARPIVLLKRPIDSAEG